MEFIQKRGRSFVPARDGLSRAQTAVFRDLTEQVARGEYEEAEVRAQALADRPRRPWDRSRHHLPVWLARTIALTAAVLHGRRGHVLPELDALTRELRDTSGSDRTVLLVLRVNRAVVLLGEKQYGKAEAEASDILREVSRLARLAQVADLELSALAGLAEALCGQGRFEEAETVARGNLPRATGNREASFRYLLVCSLNGQGRYEEALTEARRPTPPASRAGSGRPAMATATALHALGHREEAEVTARQALSACEQFLHSDHPRIREARDLLSRITAGEPPRDTSDAGPRPQL
ncbi:hypothetical protein [Streptomyces sp. NPDC048643]|uniref:hypothetical protein n=1 Tax=Streptomyces sp. NPDC048643 TaxID=3155637 RepID=UPI00344A4F10